MSRQWRIVLHLLLPKIHSSTCDPSIVTPVWTNTSTCALQDNQIFSPPTSNFIPNHVSNFHWSYPSPSGCPILHSVLVSVCSDSKQKSQQTKTHHSNNYEDRTKRPDRFRNQETQSTESCPSIHNSASFSSWSEIHQGRLAASLTTILNGSSTRNLTSHIQTNAKDPNQLSRSRFSDQSEHTQDTGWDDTISCQSFEYQQHPGFKLHHWSNYQQLPTSWCCEDFWEHSFETTPSCSKW